MLNSSFSFSCFLHFQWCANLNLLYFRFVFLFSLLSLDILCDEFSLFLPILSSISAVSLLYFQFFSFPFSFLSLDLLCIEFFLFFLGFLSYQ